MYPVGSRLRSESTNGLDVVHAARHIPHAGSSLQFDAEYRRFALKRSGAGGFQEFYRLLQTVHHIPGTDLMLGYADIHGDLLPINNDDNFQKAVSSANPLLRIILTRRGKALSLLDQLGQTLSTE